MNILSRTITGWAMIVFGAFLLGGSFYWGDDGWVAAIYGVIIFVLGWFVLLNKKEDEIEQIKESTRDHPKGRKGGKKKK